MTTTIRVIEACHQLGIGGTERALENFCRNLDPRHFSVTAVGFREGGVRADILRRAGHRVVVVNRDPMVWRRILQDADVLHWHGSGQLESEVFDAVEQHKPAVVIQTNVFGLADRGPYYPLIDLDLFLSNACLTRRVREDGRWGQGHSRRRAVMYYPVEVEMLQAHMPPPAHLQELRRRLGIGAAPVVGRIGRADDLKFHRVAIDMMPRLREWFPALKFLLVGPTPAIRQRVRKLGLDDAFVFLEPTADLASLVSYYCCIDVYVAASAVGESFGLGIAEAMACGKPVVSVSTPHTDNAQIELVDNGRTGLVVGPYSRLVALACRDLLADEAARTQMGMAGAQKVLSYAAPRVVGSLAAWIRARLQNDPAVFAEPSSIRPWSEEMDREYTRRLSDVYARPSTVERWAFAYQRAATALRDRLVRARRKVGAGPR